MSAPRQIGSDDTWHFYLRRLGTLRPRFSAGKDVEGAARLLGAKTMLGAYQVRSSKSPSNIGKDKDTIQPLRDPLRKPISPPKRSFFCRAAECEIDLGDVLEAFLQRRLAISRRESCKSHARQLGPLLRVHLAIG